MPKTVSQLVAEIDAQLPTNNAGQITAAVLRGVLADIVNNYQVSISQILTTSGTPSSTTILYGDGTWKSAPVGGSGGGGGTTVTAATIATTSGVPSSTTTLYGDNTWKAPSVDAAHITATGTPGPTTFLAGDNSWKAVTGGGGSTITGGGLGFNFSTLTEAKSASLASGITWFRTAGFAAVGDKGDGLYIKLTTDVTWATAAAVSGGVGGGRNAGVPLTSDGAAWILVPEYGMVKPTQFGAQVSKEWNDETFDQWPFFEECKNFLISLGYENGLTMFVPSSWYYLSKPHEMQGVSYNIRGSAKQLSTMRFPYTSHGIIFHHNQSGYITIGGEGGPYNGNFSGLTKGDIVYNGTHVYLAVTAGTPGGWNATIGNWASPPTGTASDFVDGSVHWKYIRELTFSESAALSNGQSAGGTISDIGIYCGDWDRLTHIYPSGDLSGVRINSTGIIMRNRAKVIDVFVGGFPGCGIAAIANGDPTLRGGGNCNGFHIQHVATYWNGLDGIHIGYSDANAGTVIDADIAQNGRWGLANWCFLNNTIVSSQTAYDGNPGMVARQYWSDALWNGKIYRARMPNLGLEDWPNYSSSAPDVNGAWIYSWGDGTQTEASSGVATWSSSTTYEAGGAFSSNNINDRSVWMSLYREGGTWPAQFGGRTLVFGAIGINTDCGCALFQDNKWWNVGFNTERWVTDQATNVARGQYINLANAWTFENVINNNKYSKGVWNTTGYDGNGISFQGTNSDRYDHTDYVFQTTLNNDNGSQYATPLIKFCGYGSVSEWGTGTSFLATQIPNLVIGNGGNDGRLVTMNTAAPTSGAHARGEIVWNMNASVGQPNGWRCTVAGTPGTWVAMNNL